MMKDIPFIGDIQMRKSTLLNKGFLILIGFILSSIALVNPVNAQGQNINLTLSFSNLADPGDDHYEGWLIVDGSPVSSGKFTINSENKLENLEGNEITSFSVENVETDKVTKFVVSLEPNGDTDSIPALVKLLAGDFSNDQATITPNLGVTLSSASGSYILATPSNGGDTNENSGIWFLDPSGPSAGLVLPDLTDTDWVYEGWVVINGIPVTTGKFNKTNEADNFDEYSDNQGTPPFPGEDFLSNAPSGVTFPTDISSGKAVISIEPRVDNSLDLFQFKPLVGDIPTDAVDHTKYSLADMSDTLATGSAEFSKVTSAPFNGVIEAFLLLMGIGIVFRIKSKKN
ncbi:MAG: hypothetical protein HeimC3_10710 [Candidatus Heimdallarchaeota archaeon LC_3]|nr:MAG: hypothetical protein HeimC3_10710 [Candidatus Heimdallarchaeota archaeon LC_3]